MDESRRVLLFADLELDEDREELRRQGVVVPLQPKPFELLRCLVRNRDRMVPKQELLDQIWPDVVVSDAALSSALRDLRRALGDDGASQRVIRTLRGRGYRFIAQVTERSAPETVLEPRSASGQRLWTQPESVERTGAGLGPSPLVGRGDQLAWLRRLMRKALEGEPRAAVIGGESGIGKTRLVRELAAAEHHSGIEVAIGRCHEELAIPYRPFAEALALLVRRLGGSAPLLLGDDAPLLERVLNPGAAATPAPGPPSWTDGERSRSELFLALARVVIRLSQARPTLLVVEDIHWADSATLELLAYLVMRLSDTGVGERVPLLIVATYRPEDAAGGLERKLGQLLREPISELAALGSLDDVQIRELLVGLGASEPGPTLLRAVSDATQGNPLLVHAVARQLEGAGAVAPSMEDLRLPSDFTAAVAPRVEALSESCREALPVAAFIGQQFEAPVLAAACERTASELEPLLAEAVASGLVRRYGGAFEFDHATVRQVLIGGVSREWRAKVHLRIAAALEQVRGAATGGDATEIAHHLIAAREAVDPDRLAHYASRAGDQAFAVCAWGDAARYYSAAATAADAAKVIDDSRRALLHFRSSLAYSYDGDGRLSVEACERAIEGYRRADDPTGLAWALIYRTRARFGVAAAAYGEEIDPTPLLDVADRVAKSDPGLHGLVIEAVSEAYWMARRTDAAIELAERALALGHELDDDRLRQHATMGLGLAYMQDLRMRDALDAWRQCRRYAERTDERRTPPGQRITLALQHVGRIDEAERVARESVAQARSTHNRGELALALANQAGIAVVRGEFAAAERATRAAMTEVTRSRYPWGGALALASVACARTQQGAFAEAQHALDLLVEPGVLFDDPGPHIRAGAAVYSELVRARATPDWTLDRARAASLIRLLRTAGNDPVALGPLCALVEIAELAGVPELVGYPAQQLALAVERDVVLTTGWVFLIPRVLALACRLRAEWDAAGRVLANAIRLAQRAGMRPELARAHLDAARLHSERPGGPDRARVAVHLRRARRILAAHRMDGFASEADALAGRVGELDPPLPARDSTVVLDADLDDGRDQRPLLRACVGGHGGRECASTRSSIIASFDRIGAALECAVELQYAAARAGAPLRARVGLALAERRTGDAPPSADALELARRIRDRASPAQVLVADGVRRLAGGERFAFVSALPLDPDPHEEALPLAQLEWESDRV